MDKNTTNLFKKYMKNSISFDKYCFTIEEARQYKKYLNSEKGVMSGMIKWPDNDNPDNWAGIWPGNYVAFSLYDHSKEKLLTPVEIHKRNMEYVEYSKYYYPNDVFTRLDWGQDHWIIEIDEQECSRSTLYKAELLLIYAEMTPEERMISDIEKAAHISNIGESHPYYQISTLHPYRLKLFGTDDCSYTYFFNDKTAVHGAYVIVNPCWSLVENRFIFTN